MGSGAGGRECDHSREGYYTRKYGIYSYYIIIYYMTSSASGQYAANSVF